VKAKLQDWKNKSKPRSEARHGISRQRKGRVSVYGLAVSRDALLRAMTRLLDAAPELKAFWKKQGKLKLKQG